MKRIIRIFALVMALSVLLTATSFADNGYGVTPTDRTKLHVRVNGYDVKFPDAQPYIDEAGRTMVPLRFATEALGAEVEWEQATRTAIMTKNGIVVKVSIGNNMVTIIENGATRQVQMDTTAVLKEGRTYVPIRYVAEGLGAYVDYSNSYRTVGIYQDVLTPAEIAKLHSYQRYNFMIGDYNRDVAEGKTIDSNRYPYYREFQESFASAREILFDTFTHKSTVANFNSLGESMEMRNEDEFYAKVVQEAIAELGWESDVLTVEFRTDNSCIYAYPDGSNRTFSVRGYLTYTDNGIMDNNADGHAKGLVKRVNYVTSRGLGFDVDWLNIEGSITIPIDAQIEIQSGYVNVVGIVALEQP